MPAGVPGVSFGGCGTSGMYSYHLRARVYAGWTYPVLAAKTCWALGMARYQACQLARLRPKSWPVRVRRLAWVRRLTPKCSSSSDAMRASTTLVWRYCARAVATSRRTCGSGSASWLSRASRASTTLGSCKRCKARAASVRTCGSVSARRAAICNASVSSPKLPRARAARERTPGSESARLFRKIPRAGSCEAMGVAPASRERAVRV